MEKNKNRKDLLAAGKKKLQQYRQKKDTKGSSSHGKSSHKTSNKSEHEGGVDKVVKAPPPTDKPLAPPKESELENASSPRNVEEDDINESASHSQENSVSIESDESVPFEVPQSHDVVELEPVELRKEEDRVVDIEEDGGDSSASVLLESKDVGTSIVTHETEVVQSGLPESFLTIEGGPTTDAELAPVDSLASPVTVEELNQDVEKEALPAQETSSDISLIQEKQGQEANGSGSTQYDGSVEQGHDSLQREASHVTEITEEPTNVEVEGASVLDEGTHREEGTLDIVGISVSPGTTVEAAEIPAINPARESELQPGNLQSDFSHGENLETVSSSHDLGTEWKDMAQADTDLVGTADDVNKQPCIPEGTVIVESQEKPSEEKQEVLSGRRSISLGKGIGSIDLYQLADVLRGLEEEDLRFLIKSGPSTFVSESGEMCKIPGNGFANSLEWLKEQLYFTNVAKDVLQLQLTEQIEIQMEVDQRDHQLLNEVSMLNSLLKETQECNESLNNELGQCRSELQAVAAGRDQFEKQFLRAREEVDEISARASELQTKLERSQEDLMNLSTELVDCKGLLESLQLENISLNGNLVSVTAERKKLEEEKEHLVIDNKKLSSQILEHQEHLAIEHVRHMQLEVDLKEAMVHLEQLTEENIFLSSSLEIHKTKVKEIENGKIPLFSQPEDMMNHLEGTDVPILVHDAVTDEYSHRRTESCERGVVSSLVDDPVGLLALKAQFQEAEKILQQLEKAIEGMQSHSVSLSRSVGKPALAVSKLIQAFESKVQHDDNGPEELPLAEGGRSGSDSFMLAKEQTNILRALLKELDLKANKANELFREEQEGRKLALSEFEILFEASKKHASNLESKNIVLAKNLSEYQSRIDDLESQLHNIEQSSDKMTATIVNQLENLQKEVGDKTATLEDEWNSTIFAMSETVEKLNASTGRHITSASLTAPSNALSVGSCIAASVDAATEVIEDLHKKLEAAYTDRNAILTSYEGLKDKFLELHVRNELAVGILHTVYDDLEKLVSDSCEDVRKNAVDVQDEKLLDLLSSSYGNLIEQLSRLLEERLQFKFAKNQLESELIEQRQDIEEMNKRSLDLTPILKLLEDVEAVIQVQDIKFDSDTLPVSRLESLIAILVQKYTTACEQVSLSKEQFESKVTELSELQGKMHQLNSSNLEDQQEIQVLKENLKEMDGSLEAVRAELQAKAAALEQSELRVLSVREEFESRVAELSELKGKMHQENSSSLEYQHEIQILKENLEEMDGALKAVRAELQAKVVELEQSEHRVSSVREKLSIAVAKGKGLIVQRDNLKQSLSDMSAELERCSQELQLRDSRLHEVETKLKTYSEGGERIEALESELTYIRNSATALRESFLVKDSALQRIEEILEDLELPEHFHPRDIIEKIEWLARSVAGNSLPMTDWDQKSSVEGGSYSDAGFVVMDTWKEDAQRSPDPGIDNFRRKYEELQSKFYGLAEQNEMLEQSLMERNILVQRWEGVLDRVDMPLQLRSMEPEDRIAWLGTALSEAHNDRDSLHQKIENFEAYCGSITSELEESQNKVADLEAALVSVTHERELLSGNLENLSREHDKVSEKAIQYELEKDKLLKEVTELQEKLAGQNEDKEYHQQIEDDIIRFQVLVRDVLQDEGAEEFSGSSIERFEGLLRKLTDSYVNLVRKKPVLKDTMEEQGTDNVVLSERSFEDVSESKNEEIVLLKEELEKVLGNLALVKEERDAILEKNHSLVVEFEALGKRNDDLQGRLNQEEQKFASTREKLNVAVRKGKGLVQQRDTMKQTIEEISNEVERLKSELNLRENALVQFEQRVRELSTYPEKVEALESESLFLRNCLAEKEQDLLDSRQTLSRLFDILNGIDVDVGVNITDPVHKVERLGELCHDLKAAVSASEHESKKSKRAAELLLAELNEVHERADGLQEELAQAEAALTEIDKERDVAEAARFEALSRLEKFNSVRSEERKNELAELVKLKSSVDELRKGCFSFTNLLTKFFSMDLELLRNVEAAMEAILKQKDETNVGDLCLSSAYTGMVSSNSLNEMKLPATGTWEGHADEGVLTEVVGVVGNGLQECFREIIDLREKCYKHSVSSEQQAKSLFKVMDAVRQEMTSRQESFESASKDITHLELLVKEKDTNIIVMRKNIQLLYEACSNSIVEIENRKAQIVGNGMESGIDAAEGKMGMDMKLPTRFDDLESADSHAPFTEESIRTMADTLLLAVKNSASIQSQTVENSQKELKATIRNLHEELQEKDMQRNKICTELVSQIKEAEAIGKNYLADLESSKIQVNNLEKQIESVEKERNALELRVKETQDSLASSVELHERIRSLTDVLTAKEQEIEALMQALDEEESQMEGLTNKINELEKVLRQKDLALENLEASRGKAMAKLSTTVSKFDELHQLSESLLSEVENLQSQLQGRDAEISYLRQEVTRCTNDVLVASQESNRRNSNEMQELCTWLVMMVSRLGVHDLHFDSSQIQAYKGVFEKQITSVMSELEGLRVMAQRSDTLLQVERSKVEELLHKGETLESSLREKQMQLASYQGARDIVEAPSMTSSEITEVEPMINKRAVTGASTTSHVRSMRKVNNDQVAVAIDVDPDANTLVDEEDDKVHGFKSLATSRIVPRFTRPVTDMIDGLWVSCDRALMRQPALRLGIILYWVLVHSILAASIV